MIRNIARGDLERRWWFWKGLLPRIQARSKTRGETWGVALGVIRMKSMAGRSAGGIWRCCA